MRGGQSAKDTTKQEQWTQGRRGLGWERPRGLCREWGGGGGKSKSRADHADTWTEHRRLPPRSHNNGAWSGQAAPPTCTASRQGPQCPRPDDTGRPHPSPRHWTRSSSGPPPSSRERLSCLVTVELAQCMSLLSVLASPPQGQKLSLSVVPQCRTPTSHGKVKLSGLEMHQSHRGGKGWACPRPHTQEPAEPQPTGTGNQQ